jgi:radical SAM superfamily enzyme YgiQ (UPF0313 family)
MIADAGSGMVMMVGVQSNQFPRAIDLSKQFLARGVRVAIGGFHVSGTISMLEGKDAGLQQAKELGITVFAGEAEGRLDEVLLDAHEGRLKQFYNYMNDLPNIAGTPIPLITALRAWRTAGGVTSFDAGRGCPFQCSFCTIINVQGRKSRKRSPDDIEQIVRENVAQGLHSFFITDDNFARNTDWEPILDRLIELKEKEGIRIHFIIQVDTLCHKIPNFIEKCARAGVRRVFIGLENINPDSLIGAKKRQNKITEYRKMLLAWKAARVITYAGYILGFPGDTKESIRHDIEIIKRELPVDVLEFFFLTPLPGSEDHQVLFKKNAPLDPDLNKYDLNHVCTTHPRMSQQEWEETYRMAWETYYTKDHVEAVLRRNIKMRASASNAILLMMWFGGSIHIEGVHPLEAGLFRYKFRGDRRPGFPVEPAWRFYPSFALESVAKLFRWAKMYAGLRLIYMRCKRDPKRFEYMDTALQPVTDDDVETLELFHNPARFRTPVAAAPALKTAAVPPPS